MTRQQQQRERPAGGARLPRVPEAREAGDPGDQADGEPARPLARLFARASPRPASRSRPTRRPRRATPPRGNLVAVVSNGTAVLGLGNIGALASKPVMEGKAVLFKKFANIDCFDIEVNESDPVKLAEIVGEPRADLRRDQPRGHQGAGLLRRRAALPREDEDPGVPRRPARHRDRRRRGGDQRAARSRASDRGHQDRLDRRRRRRHRLPQHADEARREAREHLALRPPRAGLRGPRRGHEPGEGGLRPGDRPAHARRGDRGRRPLPRAVGPGRADRRDGASRWRRDPIIFALANPNPEIDPAEARAANPDAIIATGRSDYPNQVNNVLCFPFIFRGALDVGATEINDAMQIACVEGIAALARASSSARGGGGLPGRAAELRARLPDPEGRSTRGCSRSSPARSPRRRWRPASRPGRWPTSRPTSAELNRSVYRSAFIMRRVFEVARTGGRRIVFAEGEDERVLHAVLRDDRGGDRRGRS